MSKKAIICILMILLGAVLASCGGNTEAKQVTAGDADREVINQISLLQGLTLGDYNGSVTVAQDK